MVYNALVIAATIFFSRRMYSHLMRSFYSYLISWYTRISLHIFFSTLTFYLIQNAKADSPISSLACSPDTSEGCDCIITKSISDKWSVFLNNFSIWKCVVACRFSYGRKRIYNEMLLLPVDAPLAPSRFPRTHEFLRRRQYFRRSGVADSH